MAGIEKKSYQRNNGFIYPINAAQKFIALFREVIKPNEEQRAMLAAAYFTLATEQNISTSLSKMHVNSAITLLKNIQVKARKENWGSQIAHAYFKRAELHEEKTAYTPASLDYQHAIEALEYYSEQKTTNDYDRLLWAQSALSIADLILNEQIDPKTMRFAHPLHYINMALEQLNAITNTDDDVWATQSYAHQVAGISLSVHHFEEAKEAFETATQVAFNVETLSISSLLSDIYSCLALLYEQQFESNIIERSSTYWMDHAMVYFGLALLFSPNEPLDDHENDMLVVESFFEMIYRVLDPFLIPLSKRVIFDLIDALIYAYLCIIENRLPNHALMQYLNENDTLDTFAQHIYWLILESRRRENKDFKLGLLEISDPKNSDYQLYWQDIYDKLDSRVSDNVVYMNGVRSQIST